ncbi:hypothetical protein COLO4_33558 [Corchorus olitorius]|uniref:Uncharacterized protein n=1 Tax=Corchorus olitorius TaxID=93759 RepID=A0A1R3GSR4_9ROSI|nr:hypothetical protein COLO4_33558 [Corchorus olitorius]
MGSFTIIERWGILIFAGFTLVLVFSMITNNRSNNGSNISVFRNLYLTLPETVSSDQSLTLELQDFVPSSDFEITLPGLKNPILPDMTKKKMGRCNIFEGKWVYDPGASPLYDSAMCPFLSSRAICQANGRPDKEYEKWRWEANQCKIPRFDAKDMLERLRGKRVVFVGDSINYGQWESLACLLYSAIPDQSHVDPENRIFVSESYNLIMEFRSAQFLVDFIVNETSTGKNTLNLDSISPAAKQWKGADIMVFNTGRWWDWFLYKRKLYADMKLEIAFKLGMKIWARWIEENVDSTKTTVFFRSLSPVHSGIDKCVTAMQPINPDQPFNLRLDESLIKGVVERTIKGMRTPVKYLDITKLTGYRNDAHSSFYWMQNETRPNPDCTHWCLPGVPDTWNQLLYATMVLDNSNSISDS